MKKSTVVIGGMVAVGVLLAALVSVQPKQTARLTQPAPVKPAPTPQPQPAPKPPDPKPCPPNRPCPHAAAAGCLSVGQVSDAEQFSVSGAEGPGGLQVVCDLPVSLRKHNVGGRDGAGLCVFTSIMHAARYQNERALWNFQDQMRAEMGGGWPQKVDQMIGKYAPGVHYMQYEGQSTEVLELALKTGRMPSVTYSGRDGVFYQSSIAHMVNLVYLDQNTAAILDNNHVEPEDHSILWMSRQEFLQRWMQGGQGGWAVVLLAPRPPTPPYSPGAIRRHTLLLPRPMVQQADTSRLRWIPTPGLEGREWALMDGNRQIGGYSAEKGGYFPLTADGWQHACEPPIDPPAAADCHCGDDCPCGCRQGGPCPCGCGCGKMRRQAGPRNYGVLLDRLSATERITVNGKLIETVAARDLIEAEVPDDSAKLSLTIVGPDAIRSTILHDLESFPELTGASVVQDYAPDSPLLQCGFVVSPAGPTLYLQQPDGRVLCRVDHYDGPRTLEAVQGAARKANPNYQPDKDPDPTKPSLIPGVPGLPNLPLVPLVLGVCAVGMGGALVLRPQRSRK